MQLYFQHPQSARLDFSKDGANEDCIINGKQSDFVEMFALFATLAGPLSRSRQSETSRIYLKEVANIQQVPGN